MTREEAIPAYDNPQPTAIQRHSLPKAQFLEDGRLMMPIAVFDDDPNAHRRAAEHRGKQLWAFRDTVEVIGWVYMVTRTNGRFRRPYEEVSAEARTANLSVQQDTGVNKPRICI